MADNICLYHTDHENRIVKNEKAISDLDDRFTDLDKESAVSRTEIVSVLKNLEKLPATMAEISVTMVSMQGEISNSNKRMGSLEDKFSKLDSRFTKFDEEGKINVRTWFLDWIKSNWLAVAVGLAAILYLGANFFKDILK